MLIVAACHHLLAIFIDIQHDRLPLPLRRIVVNLDVEFVV